MPTCILMEKPSAFKHMIQAINYADKPSQRPADDKATKVNSMEAKAHFNGHDYLITHSVGCIREYVDPVKMLKNPKLKKQYASWNANAPLWNPNDFNWKQKTMKGKESVLNGIRDVANKCNAFIIAGDTDNSAEGDLLQCDILRAIGWNWKQNPVYRIRFDDDSIISDLRNALKNGIKSMTDSANIGMIRQGQGRSHWDYLSMQETRKATDYARKNGYKVPVVNEGRLKSVILLQIWKRWQARKAYVKKPYWEVQFKDENGHVYSRKASYKDHPDFRFTDQDKAKADLQNYHPSKPANIKKQTKTQAPGKLLNLASLGAILNRQGFSPAQVQSTYQKMYENGIVSYPRTDDKAITTKQWDKFNQIADKVAKYVGINPKLISYRKPRKKIITKHADHGANRIIKALPLSSLSKYGACGQAIYKVLAKNFLAELAPDYVYERITAQLADYPKFKTSYSIPKEMNWKLVFNDNSKKKSDSTKPLGNTDNPFLHTGTNPKPGKPTTKWLYNMLDKYNVGTGATRQSTVVELSSGKASSRRLNVKRGTLTLTSSGTICAEMARGTMIGDVKTTAKLFELMNQVKTGKIHVSDIEATAAMVVKNDKPIFAQNAKHLDAPKAPVRETFPVEVNGQKQNVNRKFMTHRFTDDEVTKLKNGEEIEIGPFKSKGTEFDVKGKLDWNTFKGHKFYGFKLTKFIPKNQKEKVTANFDGKQIQFNRVFAKHRFTDDEVQELIAHKNIAINIKTNAGKTMKVIGKLAKQSYDGHTFYGFKLLKLVPNAAMKKRIAARAARPSATINGKTGKFNPVFAQHKFTDKELTQLEAGSKVKATFKSKKGKSFTANVKLKWQSFRGHKFLGYDMSFK